MNTVMKTLLRGKDFPNLMDILNAPNKVQLFTPFSTALTQLKNNSKQFDELKKVMLNEDTTILNELDSLTKQLELWEHNKQFNKEDVVLIEQIFNTYIKESATNLPDKLFATLSP